MGPLFYRYDVFISHAVEDKESIANELYDRLKESTRLRIWYSGKKLIPGESIEKTIYKGLRRSRYGIAILSPTYLRKNWTTQELHSLLFRERDKDHVIFPILHQITLDEIVEKYPFMRDRYCISSNKGMDNVIRAITDKIKPSLLADILRLVCIVLLTMLMSFSAYQYAYRDYPPADIVMEEITKRIETFQQNIEAEHISQHKTSDWKTSSPENIGTLFTAYRNLKAYYRNEYEFANGYTSLRFKKYVEPALGLDLESLTPFNSYQLTSPQIYLAERTVSGEKEAAYALVNTQPVHYAITHSYAIDDHTYVVTVSYENNIRYIGVNLAFATDRARIKKHRMKLLGFLPQEKYTFEEEREGKWKIKSIE
jgi:hypothetical protein